MITDRAVAQKCKRAKGLPVGFDAASANGETSRSRKFPFLDNVRPGARLASESRPLVGQKFDLFRGRRAPEYSVSVRIASEPFDNRLATTLVL